MPGSTSRFPRAGSTASSFSSSSAAQLLLQFAVVGTLLAAAGFALQWRILGQAHRGVPDHRFPDAVRRAAAAAAASTTTRCAGTCSTSIRCRRMRSARCGWGSASPGLAQRFARWRTARRRGGGAALLALIFAFGARTNLVAERLGRALCAGGARDPAEGRGGASCTATRISPDRLLPHDRELAAGHHACPAQGPDARQPAVPSVAHRRAGAPEAAGRDDRPADRPGGLHAGHGKALRAARPLALRRGRQVVNRPEAGDGGHSRRGGAFFEESVLGAQRRQRLGGVHPGRAAPPLRDAARQVAAARPAARRAYAAPSRPARAGLLWRAGHRRRADGAQGRLLDRRGRRFPRTRRAMRCRRRAQGASIALLLHPRRAAREPARHPGRGCGPRDRGVDLAIARQSGDPGAAGAVSPGRQRGRGERGRGAHEAVQTRQER